MATACNYGCTTLVQMKAEKLRNPKMSLHVPIAAPKLELWALNVIGQIYLIAAVYSHKYNAGKINLPVLFESLLRL